MAKKITKVRLLSWNVNGIRAVLKKGFLDFLKKTNPDVLCLQETKGMAEDIEKIVKPYSIHINLAEKKGYSGTAILTKRTPLKVTQGIGIAKHDHEGRVITAEYEKFFLVNVYVPNAKRGLERLPYRSREWDVDFLKYLKKLEKRKPVVFCGDMNVAHQAIDLTNPKSNQKTHGFTPEERAGFDNIVKAGFVDTFRSLHKEGGHYTWWSQFSNCRKRNIGWRIDYFCISASLESHLQKAFILPDVLGSDHCPVGIEIKV